MIDASTHAIDSVNGTVSILLQHGAVPDIKPWDGSLHANLAAQDNAGDLLFPLPMTGFHANVLGFDALGTPDVILGKDSVSIPMALKLPPYLGVTGAATLAANMTDDLEPASLRMTIPDMVFAGLEASHASLDWAGPAQQWHGTVELQMQPRGRSGRDGRAGSDDRLRPRRLRVRPLHRRSYLGTSIYRNAYLEDLDAAFDLHPALSLTGNAELGAVAHGEGVCSLQATGPLRTAFGNSSTMTVAGDGAVYGVPLTSARATFDTDGVLNETGTLGFDAGGVPIGGSVDATAALFAGTISGTIDGGFSFGPYSVGKTAARPGADRVRVAHRGRLFLVRIGAATGAARYLVSVRPSLRIRIAAPLYRAPRRRR